MERLASRKAKAKIKSPLKVVALATNAELVTACQFSLV